MVKKVTIMDIQQALTPNYIKVSQILFFGIMMGATAFLFFIIYMYMNGPVEEPMSDGSVEIIHRFSMIHGALFVAGLALSGFLHRWFLGEARIESMAAGAQSGDSAAAVRGYLAIIRTAKIIRASLLEVPVFFGLVTCFMAVTNRVMYQYPYYWANALSYAVFIVMLIVDFPTKDKYLEMFKNKLKFLLQY